jgi:hypothetical protein
MQRRNLSVPNLLGFRHESFVAKREQARHFSLPRAIKRQRRGIRQFRFR